MSIFNKLVSTSNGYLLHKLPLAIESDFIALADQEIKLAKVDDEKRLLMGAALIPNKPIFRKNGENTFYVYFSEKTVRRASELFFQNSMQNHNTLYFPDTRNVHFLLASEGHCSHNNLLFWIREAALTDCFVPKNLTSKKMRS